MTECHVQCYLFLINRIIFFSDRNTLKTMTTYIVSDKISECDFPRFHSCLTVERPSSRRENTLKSLTLIFFTFSPSRPETLFGTDRTTATGVCRAASEVGDYREKQRRANGREEDRYEPFSTVFGPVYITVSRFRRAPIKRFVHGNKKTPLQQQHQ